VFQRIRDLAGARTAQQKTQNASASAFSATYEKTPNTHMCGSSPVVEGSNEPAHRLLPCTTPLPSPSKTSATACSDRGVRTVPSTPPRQMADGGEDTATTAAVATDDYDDDDRPTAATDRPNITVRATVTTVSVPHC